VFADRGDSLLVRAKGKIFINCATITPKTHVEVGRRAKRRGARALEGCMASSIPQARQGTLYLMCAGERKCFERVRPILERLSTALRFVGRAGRAAQVKALVNMVMNANTAALAEGLGLGAALGLDLGMLREVFAQTGAQSQVLRTDGEDMQHRAHECYFSAAHAAKDSNIAWALGCEAGLHMPVAAATKLQFETMVSLGLGGLDKSGVAELTFKGRRG
jgi:3-hydroxyisobutyrate dehydrogenase